LQLQSHINDTCDKLKINKGPHH